MITTMVKTFAITCVLCVTAQITFQHTATACGNSIEHQQMLNAPASFLGQDNDVFGIGSNLFGSPKKPIKYKPHDVHFQKGEYQSAISSAIKTYHLVPTAWDVDQLLKDSAKLKHVAAMQTIVISTIRRKGHVTFSHGHIGLSFGQRFAPEANIQLAIKTLEVMRKHRPQDTELEAALAEAWALQPQSKTKAFQTLSKLAKKDLIPDANGHAAMAKLAVAHNDAFIAYKHIQRCLKTARDKKICPTEYKPQVVLSDVLLTTQQFVQMHRPIYYNTLTKNAKPWWWPKKQPTPQKSKMLCFRGVEVFCQLLARR